MARAREMIDLDVEEVSNVDRPANKRKYLVVKRVSKMDGDAATFDEINAAREVYRMMDELSSMYSTLSDSLYRIASDGLVADKLAMIRTSIEEFSQAARDLFDESGVSKEGRKVSAARMKRIQTAFDALKAVMEEAMATKDTNKGAKLDEGTLSKLADPVKTKVLEWGAAIEKRATDAEAEIVELKKKLEAAEKKETPPSDDDVLKGLPEAVRKRLEKAEAKADEADKVAKEERGKRIEAEAVAKAEKEYPLVGDAKALGPIMKRARDNELSSDDCDELERVLTAASKQLKESGLLKSIGKDGGDAQTGNAWDEIEKKAQDLKKSDPKLTIEQARIQAMDADPALAKRYREEKNASH